MAPSRPDLTAVRRAVGVAAVSFLLSGAVVYGLAPDVPTSGPSPDTTATASASPAPTTVATHSGTPGGQSSGADPSRTFRTSEPTSTPTHGAGDSGGSGSAEPQTIQVEAPTAPAMLFETVRIQGTYHGGARHLSAGAALGEAPVAGLPATHQDRPVGPVHRLRRVGRAGSLLASRAGPQLRRDVQTLSAHDQGLTTAGYQPPGLRTESSLAKTMTLSRYLCLASS